MFPMKKVLSDVTSCLLFMWYLNFAIWWWSRLVFLCDRGICGTVNLVLSVMTCLLVDYGLLSTIFLCGCDVTVLGLRYSIIIYCCLAFCCLLVTHE